jgi:hypothetical protein
MGFAGAKGEWHRGPVFSTIGLLAAAALSVYGLFTTGLAGLVGSVLCLGVPLLVIGFAIDSAIVSHYKTINEKAQQRIANAAKEAEAQAYWQRYPKGIGADARRWTIYAPDPTGRFTLREWWCIGNSGFWSELVIDADGNFLRDDLIVGECDLDSPWDTGTYRDGEQIYNELMVIRKYHWGYRWKPKGQPSPTPPPIQPTPPYQEFLACGRCSFEFPNESGFAICPSCDANQDFYSPKIIRRRIEGIQDD